MCFSIFVLAILLFLPGIKSFLLSKSNPGFWFFPLSQTSQSQLRKKANGSNVSLLRRYFCELPPWSWRSEAELLPNHSFNSTMGWPMLAAMMVASLISSIGEWLQSFSCFFTKFMAELKFWLVFQMVFHWYCLNLIWSMLSFTLTGDCPLNHKFDLQLLHGGELWLCPHNQSSLFEFSAFLLIYFCSFDIIQLNSALLSVHNFLFVT